MGCCCSAEEEDIFAHLKKTTINVEKVPPNTNHPKDQKVTITEHSKKGVGAMSKDATMTSLMTKELIDECNNSNPNTTRQELDNTKYDESEIEMDNDQLVSSREINTSKASLFEIRDRLLDNNVYTQLSSMLRMSYTRPRDKIKGYYELNNNSKINENPFGFTPYDDGLMRGNYGFSDRILATQNIITELEEKDEKD